MRIGIDAHMVGTRETGNETYCRGLVEGIAVVSDQNQYTVYVRDEKVMADVGTGKRMSRRVLQRDSNLWRLGMGFAGLSRSDGLDLLHVTYNAPLFTKCPLVVSVHDISYVHFPEFFSKRDLRLLNTYVPYSIRASRQVITLSESAAGDIERVYRVPRERIQAIPLAARPVFKVTEDTAAVQASCARYGLSGDFMLAVGNLQPRKNLARLVEAFAKLPPSLRDLRLAIVGAGKWKESELFARVAELGLEKRVLFTGYVSDEDLALLYNAGMGLIYPSLYEGFGLPILEAMQCGTPVICSNTSSMPEVAGDAALLIDPLDTAGMADAIARLAQSATLRESLKRAGLKRAALFNWAETARKTVEVYGLCA